MRFRPTILIAVLLLVMHILTLPAGAEMVTEDEDDVIFLTIDDVTESDFIPEEDHQPSASVPELTLQADDPETAWDSDESEGFKEAAEPYTVIENPDSASDERTLTFSFLGDCSIGDTVKSVKRKNSMTGTLKEHSSDWLFSTVSDILHADDFTFANLECVLTDNMSPLYPLKTFNLVGPSSHREILAESGIDGINTVNNHCIDFKYAGYEDTMANLEAVGIVHFGTLNPARSSNRYINLGRVEIKGVRIGITGYSYPLTEDVLDFIRQDIALLRSEGCQIVVVSLHWGTEEKKVPNKGQFPYAAKILDAGADVIWGHHPHVLQPVYFYKGKPIFFSTGNFVFGSISNLDPSTGIFQLTWDIEEDGNVSLASFNMIPAEIRHNKEFRPLLLTNRTDIKKCLKKLIGIEKAGFTSLPEGFEQTGKVYLAEDGSLSLSK